MKTKRTYRAVNVHNVVGSSLLALLPATVVLVGLDVAKFELAAAFAGPDGLCQFLVRFKHPGQTLLFLDLLEQLIKGGKQLQVAMEPTGTYGDALCGQLHQRQIPVYLVSPKKTHDAAELYDGVPSKHDNKDATLVVRLHAQGLSKHWQPQQAERRKLRALVTRREIYADSVERLHGKLEPLLARHWPELDGLMELRRSSTVLHVLQNYPAPALVKDNAQAVRELMGRHSRRRLTEETINAVIQSAQTTLGVPVVQQEQELLCAMATELLRLIGEQDQVGQQIKEALAEQGPGLRGLTAMLGATTTAVVVSMLGDPAGYSSAEALTKGCGLNLKERSSGTDKDRGLHITKRGPAMVRKYLHLATLRWLQKDPVARAWYLKRSGYREDSKMRAVVALTRKLVKAIWHVAKGQSYEASRLFDLRRLKLETKEPGVQPSAAA